MADPPRSAEVLVKMIISSPSYLADLAKDPQKTLEAVAKLATESLPPPAYVSDKLTYRIVVGSLGVVAIAAMLGAIFLSTLSNVQIPDVLTALGAAAIGALAGLLAPSPK
jgi:hypothetical protein